MNVLDTQQLLERLASLLRTETRNLLIQHGLQPVQLEALYYLSICNRYSDTPMAVTDYLGQTKGSVSQTLKVLEKKSLIERRPDKADRRVSHLEVTIAGRRLIAGILPSPLLETLDRHLSNKETVSIEVSLQTLLRGIQQANHLKTFGQCATCRHNTRRSDHETICGLTSEALSNEDVTLICREHEFAT